MPGPMPSQLSVTSWAWAASSVGAANAVPDIMMRVAKSAISLRRFMEPSCGARVCLGCYPFNEPTVKPRTKYRWKNGNISRMGPAATIAIA